MPFDARGLKPLIVADPFTLWHYETTDSRAAVLATGYFDAVSGQLQQGHLVVVRAADAMALVPVRPDVTVGNGLVLDSGLAPIRLSRAAAMRFGVSVRVNSGARTVTLDAVPSSVAAGGTLSLGATATGISRLAFTVIDPAGAAVGSTAIAAVSGGRATAVLTAPATAGNGYRVRAANADDATLSALSAAFAVTSASTGGAVTTEALAALLTEDGNRLAA